MSLESKARCGCDARYFDPKIDLFVRLDSAQVLPVSFSFLYLRRLHGEWCRFEEGISQPVTFCTCMYESQAA